MPYSLSVADLDGDGTVEAGVYNTHIFDMETGVYFVRVESGPWSDTCSFVVTE